MTVMNKTDPEKVGPTPTQHSANGQILTGSPWKMGHMFKNVINSNKVNSNLSNFEPKYKVDHCLYRLKPLIS